MNQKIANSILIIAAIAFMISIISCYKHEEGCRDINALNYDVRADKDCENNCCNYPGMEFEVSLLRDSIRIDTIGYFTTDSGDSIRIKFLRMYLSDFRFISIAGDTIPVTNLITIGKREGSGVTYENENFTALKFNTEIKQYNLGTLKKLIMADRLLFKAGIPEHINYSVIDRIRTDNPLFPSFDDMYISEEAGYYFLRMTIVSQSDPELIKSISIKASEIDMEIVIGTEFDYTKRKKQTAKLNIDSKTLFADIDISDKEELIRKKIIENIKNAFY
jgi:hypothetical protein